MRPSYSPDCVMNLIGLGDKKLLLRYTVMQEDKDRINILAILIEYLMLYTDVVREVVCWITARCAISDITESMLDGIREVAAIDGLRPNCGKALHRDASYIGFVMSPIGEVILGSRLAAEVRWISSHIGMTGFFPHIPVTSESFKDCFQDHIDTTSCDNFENISLDTKLLYCFWCFTLTAENPSPQNWTDFVAFATTLAVDPDDISSSLEPVARESFQTLHESL